MEGKERRKESRNTPSINSCLRLADSIVEYSIEYLIEYSNTRPIPEVAINYRLSGPKQ